MRKFQIVLLALVAVFAFGAVLAASASAEITLLAEWLVNGNPVVGETTVTETTGAVLFEDNKTPFGAAAVLCSWIFVGKVGPSGIGSIASVLNLAKELIGEELVGLAVECEGEKLCSTPALVWPALLPWQVLLFLMEGTPGEILLLLAFHIHLECTVLGIKETDLCLAADIEIPILNDPLTGDAEMPGASHTTPNLECSLGGANSGVTETDELAEITSPSGLLTVSSEGVG